ncbi:pyroglutamyl-peptidase I [Alteribacillus sp. HJP-4]|uniref:pyroglutamyl-peptidase I n=1 Tax=Alteribacillus sp. HJP-4 TaxID=2775394 RepID=UPI0035CCED60
MPITILCSGFEPFGGMAVNPTEQLVKDIEREYTNEDVNIQSFGLPVDYETCADQLIEAVIKNKPDAVFACGLAYGRSAVTVERIGINVQDTIGEGQKGDNRGRKPVDDPIVDGGPDGLFATLPIRSIVERLRQDDIPARISNTAGTYICNTTLYRLMYEIKRESLATKAGFIHFPATPEMTAADTADTPSMSYFMQKQALKAAIDETVISLKNNKFSKNAF